MTLLGKISTEIGVHATAEKWYNLFATQLHHVQNLADRVHGTKLHHGEDWHHNESIKHWTYVIGNSTSNIYTYIFLEIILIYTIRVSGDLTLSVDFEESC